MRDENGDPMIMENWEKSQGATFFHETMHMSQLVTSPKAKDSAYGPKLVYELARNRNTDAAVYNADSWTMAAQAILAQRSLNLQSPPFPLEHPLEGLAGGYMVPQPDKYPQSVLEEVSGFVPEGAEGTSPPFFVNPDIWEVYVAPPPVVPEPKVPTK
jgi:hypothetical protein